MRLGSYSIETILAGTLNLSEDKKGLYFENIPPPTTWANDLRISMKRGDINQMSFGFNVIKDAWNDLDKETPKRDLIEVKLYEVSVVTFPAYPGTEATARALPNGMTIEEIYDVIEKLNRGEKLDNETLLRYHESVEYFRSIEPVPVAETVPPVLPVAETVDLTEWRKLQMEAEYLEASLRGVI